MAATARDYQQSILEAMSKLQEVDDTALERFTEELRRLENDVWATIDEIMDGI